MVKLLSSLPVGAKVKDTNTKYNGEAITWLVGGHNHYGANQTALVSERIISLKAFDAKEASNSNSSRQSYGNNRYAHSNIRQWLNSSASSWYSAQHSADAPPNNANVGSNYNEYDAEPGFLTNFSENMRNALVPTTLTVAKNTATDGGGSETVSDKVFLLSNTEVGLTNENSIAEGKLMSLFSTATNRIAKPTAVAVSKSEYTNSSLNANSVWYYWLRTPHASNSSNARSVDSDGSLSSFSAYNGNTGVRPALNLNSTIAVSDAPDADGAYVIQWNATPNVNLSAPTDATTLYENTAYTISGNATDADNGNIVNIRYSINDGTAKALATGISDGNTAISFTKTLTFKNGKLFDGDTAITDTLAEGTAHMLRVWATDDQGATSTIISRSFYVVPNRAPVLTIDTPQPTGTIGSDKFTISGQASDIDGNDVVVTYRINSGLAKEIYRGQGAPFSFDVTLKELAVGTNDIVIEVSDTYAFKASKTVRIRKDEVKTEVTAGTVRYKLSPPKGSAKGLVIWVQRDANLTIDASVSAQLAGEQEAYVAMTKTTTAPVNDSTFEDEFIFEASEPKTDIMLKFELNGTGTIKLITGAIE